MFKILKKIMIYLLFVVILLIVATFFVLQLPQFGKNPTGDRLERIKKSAFYKGDSFKNLSETPDLAEGVGYYDVMKDFLFKKAKDVEPTLKIPSIKTDLKNLPDGKPQLVWFGHSSYLIKINGKHILLDPVFSGAASPFSFTTKNFAGSNEYTVDDFPEIDILMISHDHYDHLDYETIKKLQPKVKQVVTSLGVGSHLEFWGYEPSKITELEWWQEVQIDSTTKITSTPARHFSGRGFKRNQTLWSSFVLKSGNSQIYIGGDSGYDNHFKEIGKKFGSFDLAILECGQYNEYWKYIHMMPEETAIAATELNAKVLFPVHWGKFGLAMHAWTDPIERVTKKAGELHLSTTTPRIGEVVEIGGSLSNNKWWIQ